MLFRSPGRPIQRARSRPAGRCTDFDSTTFKSMTLNLSALPSAFLPLLSATEKAEGTGALTLSAAAQAALAAAGLTSSSSNGGLTLTIAKSDGTAASITAFQSVLQGVIFVHSNTVSNASGADETSLVRTVTLSATDASGNALLDPSTNQALSVALSLSQGPFATVQT